VYNLGVSGDNSNDLEERFKTEVKARKPDVILFSIGTNDSQYIKHTKNPRVSITQFKKKLVRIIKETRECNIEKVMFIELIPVVENKVMPIPWSPSKFYDNQNIKKYNQIIKEVAEENDVPFCPMFDLLKEEDLDDGLHPNTQGHKKMFKRIKNFLEKEKTLQQA
jgi:lysophospholipase L1-like esterase